MRMQSLMRWAATPALLLALAACNNDGSVDEKTGEIEPSSQTLAVALDGDLAGVATNSGLASALEGVGPYTVLAPTDAALAGSPDLDGEAMRAQAAALLRAHIVPGALTRADIEAAVARAEGGRAQMRTMSDGMVTFSRDGDALVVTTEDGGRARLVETETLASNGVIQPIDAVLAPAETPAG